MYFSMGHMMWNWPVPGWLEGNHVAMGLIQLLFTTAVMVINQKFFVSGFRSLWLCSFPVFQGIYRMVNRMAERSGQSIYLMLCTIIDSKGNPMRDGEQLEQLAGRLGDAICKSIRRGDAVNR